MNQSRQLIIQNIQADKETAAKRNNSILFPNKVNCKDFLHLDSPYEPDEIAKINVSEGYHFKIKRKVKELAIGMGSAPPSAEVTSVKICSRDERDEGECLQFVPY